MHHDAVPPIDFFDESEVVLALNQEEYFDKSIYYMRNVDKQAPYIEKILSRIQNEYNQRLTWKNILDRVYSE